MRPEDGPFLTFLAATGLHLHIRLNLGRKQGERWRAFTEGGAMVFEALQSHFPKTRVAMLSYHADAPQRSHLR